MSVLTSLQFPKFWKQDFMYFGHIHVETGRNCSREFATSHNYFNAYFSSHIFLIKYGISDFH